MAGSCDLTWSDFEHLKQNDQILKLNIEESSHTYCGPTFSPFKQHENLSFAKGELGDGCSELGKLAYL